MSKRIKKAVKKALASYREQKAKTQDMESQMRIKIRPAVGGIKRVGAKAGKSVIHGMSDGWIKRNLSGYEKSAFKAAARRLRRRK